VDETIRRRSLLYLLMVLLSATLMVAAVYLGRWFAPRLGSRNATLGAAGAYVVAVGVVMAGNVLYQGFSADEPLRVPARHPRHPDRDVDHDRAGCLPHWLPAGSTPAARKPARPVSGRASTGRGTGYPRLRKPAAPPPTTVDRVC
jgi:Probable cobalt transporter subunit (CbtA)